jgi:1,2-phenylacetyl-CoA epoxidase catalytic subunit
MVSACALENDSIVRPSPFVEDLVSAGLEIVRRDPIAAATETLAAATATNVAAAAAEAGVGVDPATVREAAESVLDQVLTAADVPRPEVARRSGVLGRTGRDGMHGEPLSLMLAEMQSVARAHPRGQW